MGDVPVWQIEAVPREEREIEKTGYERSILFVRQDNYVVTRAVHWLHSSNRLKLMDVKQLQIIDGIWVPTEVHMTTRAGDETLHKTVLVASRVRFGEDRGIDFFRPRALERGL